jgi:hypothetical protein
VRRLRSRGTLRTGWLVGQLACKLTALQDDPLAVVGHAERLARITLLAMAQSTKPTLLIGHKYFIINSIQIIDVFAVSSLIAGYGRRTILNPNAAGRKDLLLLRSCH